MNGYKYINDEYDKEFSHILDTETEEEYNDLEIITNLLNEQNKELEVYKRAFEVACNYSELGYQYSIHYCIDQARKELEEKDE